MFSLRSLVILKTTVYVTASSRESRCSLVSSRLDESMHIPHLPLRHRSLFRYKRHIPIYSAVLVSRRKISHSSSTMAPIIHCVRHAQVKFPCHPPQTPSQLQTLITLLPGLPQPRHRKPCPSRPASYPPRRRAMLKSARELSVPQAGGYGRCVSHATNNLHRTLRF